MVCTGPIAYHGEQAVRMDTENLAAARAGLQNVEEAFMTAAAPGSIARRLNEYYPTEEAFLFAIAEAMKVEYKAIVDAGFILQIDDPQLVTRYDRENPVPPPESTAGS